MSRTAPRIDPATAADDPNVELDENLPPIHFVSPEEGRRIFDEAAREMMGMSGEEFIARWEAGEYWGIADEPGYRHIGDLISMITLARQKS